MTKIMKRLKATCPKDAIVEIKALVDLGVTVYCDNEGYIVLKDGIGQYLIHFKGSDYYINLHGLEGTEFEHTLNTDLKGVFYFEELSAVSNLP